MANTIIRESLKEIVANKENGIDVDKWDYLARDCHMLGIRDNFDHQRCMQVARVCDVDVNGNMQKHVSVTRIHDAFKEANDSYRQIIGKNNEKKLMSEAIKDMIAYTNLTDDVLYDIGRSTDKALEKSRQIIDRIVRRDFYKLVVKDTSQREVKEEDIERKMIEADRELSHADFTVTVVKFDYGKKEKKPLKNVYYYCKSVSEKGIKLSQIDNYLVKWHGYNRIESTWEPENHLSRELVKKPNYRGCIIF